MSRFFFLQRKANIKIQHNLISQNKYKKHKSLNKIKNINFQSSRIAMKTTELQDEMTKQFFEKLVYYWQKLPENCKTKKPVSFDYKDGIAGFLVDKTIKDKTKFIIKSGLKSIDEWSKFSEKIVI